MTDNEIIKALEHCSDNGECKDCPAKPHIVTCGCCMNGLMKRAHDLINRQKAEIENQNRQIGELVSFQRFCERKAIKEFAKILKRKIRKFTEYDDGGWDSTVYVVKVEDIDNLAEEMEKQNQM